MAGNIRLIKIASEINIGKDAIVDFLRGKGFVIENKPTTILNEDMVNAIYDKFKKEKKAAETQREKIEKHKQIRKTSDPKAKNDENHSSVVAMHNEENVPQQIIDSVPADSPVDELEMHSVDTNVNGNNSINEIPEIQSIQQVPDIQIVTENLQSDSVQIAEPIMDKPKEKHKEKAKEFAEKVQLFDKIETSVEVITEDSYDKYEHDDELINSDDEGIDDIDDDDDEIVIPPVPGAAIVKKDDPKAANKKKKKRKKIAEVEYEVGESPKLKGLTIVGKIDLSKPKPAAKPVNKPSGKVNNIPKFNDEDEDTSKSKGGAKPGLKNKKNKKGKVVKEVAPVVAGKTDKKKKKRVSVREMITTEDVDKAIKQTLSDMGEASAMSNRNKLRMRKKAEREEKNIIKMEEEAKEANILHLTEFVTTADLAKLIGVTANEIILKCIGLGLMVSINQRLDKDTIAVISDDYGLEVEFVDDKAIQAIDEMEDDEEDLLPRSPIVTIMGHVDHGKTSLLDYIRNANVVAGEAGGITQHIGAYRVKLENNKHITFLDTPGHEAFTAMRARGAQVTDIVILVVSADDSVMPQTIEAISHSLAANVPIIVAINKIDKPDSQPDRIRQQLADHNVLVEEWGGKYQCVEISAKKGINIDKLLEKILLEAEMLELKANPDRTARGTVIEANMTKGFGPVCTVIVQKGTLSIGDAFVAGHQYGRVRAMLDERGNKIETAGPSIPVRVIGLNGLPEAGDILTSVDTDVEARNIATERQQLRRQQEFRRVKQITLDDISKKIHEGAVKDLYLIIKGDVGGSVEALSDSLQKLSTDEVRVNIIHKGVGTISESDVMLAVASGAIVIGFQVSPTGQARRIAENESVDIRQYSIIYDCIDEVRRALEGLLTPELKEDVIAVIEVRKVFKISRLGVIAGCQVMNGKIHRNDKVRLMRDGLPVFTGNIDSLKRNKDDVREVDSGYECGIALVGYNDIEVGDIIEGFKVSEIKRKLQ